MKDTKPTQKVIRSLKPYLIIPAFSLPSIKIDNNLISGSIPASLLSGLSNVEVFYLNSNRLTGSLPSEIGRLTDVEDLQLCKLGVVSSAALTRSFF